MPPQSQAGLKGAQALDQADWDEVCNSPIKFILFGCLSFWLYHGWFLEQEYSLSFSSYIKSIIILNQSKFTLPFYGGRLKSLSYISFEISISPSLSFLGPRLWFSLALWTILLVTSSSKEENIIHICFLSWGWDLGLSGKYSRRYGVCLMKSNINFFESSWY